MADPRQGSFDDPALGQNDEIMRFVALDDFDDPAPGGGGRLRHAGSLIAGVGKDALDEGKEAARAAVENQPSTIAILQVGRMNGDVQQETERIDEDVPLAARNLLARVEALRVERGAPF